MQGCQRPEQSKHVLYDTVCHFWSLCHIRDLMICSGNDHIFRCQGVPPETALWRHLAPPLVQGFSPTHSCIHVDTSRYCVEIALLKSPQGRACNARVFVEQCSNYLKNNSSLSHLDQNVLPSRIRPWQLSFWCSFGPQTSQRWLRLGGLVVLISHWVQTCRQWFVWNKTCSYISSGCQRVCITKEGIDIMNQIYIYLYIYMFLMFSAEQNG